MEAAKSMTARRVLLVDDDDDLRLLCRLFLEADGHFEVQCASSGEEALALTAQERFDLILLDLCMPGMDGVHTLAQLRAQPKGAGIPVVLMTAAGDGIERPGDWAAVLYKPFDARGLARELARIADQR